MMLKRTLALALIALLLVSVVPFALAQEDTQNDDLSVDLELVVDGLVHPLGLTHAGDDSGRLFVWDQTGQIWILDENGKMLEEPFLDLTDRMVELSPDYDERGLMGVAFHPDYATNGRFFVYYSAPLRDGAPAEWDHTSHISEFMVSEDDPNVANPDSERVILQVDQPQMNHNGGQIAFGPDGYLYIPLGDGGGADDVDVGHTPETGNAQDTSNLLGSILRLDVDGEEPYGVPTDNPFVDSDDVLPEIYAYGFRNPYRMSFDAGGDNGLYVGDAGQNQWEEIDLVEAGGNYGWNIKEGTHCFDAANPDAQVEECADTGAMGENLIDPIIEYQNANVEGGLGVVVIGGNVYRGSAIPEFEGNYIFGDWSTGWDAGEGHLLMATPSQTQGELWQYQELTIASTQQKGLGAFLLSFGQDAENELYVLTTTSAGPSGNTGAVYKIVAADSAGEAPAQGDAASPTATVEATGTVTATATTTVTVGADDEADVVPSIVVEDQSIEDGTVTVASATADGPSWLVIEADDNGMPGEVLGFVALKEGENTNVVVDIDTEKATETLWAMIHTDAGVAGTFEFPGDDAPVEVEDEMLMEAFQVTGLEADVAAQPTAAATAETTATVSAEQPRTLPETGGPTPPWTSILLMAGGLAALLGGTYLLRRRQAEDSNNS